MLISFAISSVFTDPDMLGYTGLACLVAVALVQLWIATRGLAADAPSENDTENDGGVSDPIDEQNVNASSRRRLRLAQCFLFVFTILGGGAVYSSNLLKESAQNSHNQTLLVTTQDAKDGSVHCQERVAEVKQEMNGQAVNFRAEIEELKNHHSRETTRLSLSFEKKMDEAEKAAKANADALHKDIDDQRHSIALLRNENKTLWETIKILKSGGKPETPPPPPEFIRRIIVRYAFDGRFDIQRDSGYPTILNVKDRGVTFKLGCGASTHWVQDGREGDKVCYGLVVDDGVSAADVKSTGFKIGYKTEPRANLKLDGAPLDPSGHAVFYKPKEPDTPTFEITR